MLTEVYGEIYKHIVAQKGSAPRLALNAFRWIQCSYEPIRTQTLLDAITAEIGHLGEISHEDTMPHVASFKGHEGMARLLIDRGADVSAADKVGLTSLHVASERGL